MAKLTDQLPNSDGIISAPVLNVGPSPLAVGLNGITQGLETFVQTQRRNAEDKRAKAASERQAKEDAYRDEDRSVYEAVGKALIANNQDNYQSPGIANSSSSLSNADKVFGVGKVPITEMNPDGSLTKNGIEINEIYLATGEVGKKIALYDAAVKQGRLPGISKTAMTDQIVLDMFNRFPGHGETVLKAFEALGVKSTIIDETRAQQDDIDAQRSAARNSRTAAYEYGIQRLDPDIASEMSENEIVEYGFTQQKRDHDFNRTKEEFQFRASVAAEDRTATTFTQTQTGKTLADIAIVSISQSLSPYITSFNKFLSMAGQPGASAGIETRLQDIYGRVQQQTGVLIENGLAQLGVTDREEAAKVRSYFEAYIKSNFLTPMETRNKSYADAAAVLKNRLNIDATVSMPFINALKEAGVRVDSTPLLIETFLQVPGNREKLQSELQGLSNLDVTQTPARIKLAQVVSLLAGNSQLADYSPRDAKSALVTTANFSLKVAPTIARGQLEQADYFLNSQGVTIAATGSINQASDWTSIQNAGLALTGNGKVRAALGVLKNNSEWGQEASIVGQGSRAAAALLYQQGLTKLRSGDNRVGQFITEYKNGRWVVTASTTIKSTVQSGLPKGHPVRVVQEQNALRQQQALIRSGPPKALLERVGTMNSLLDHIVETADWDTNTPKASNMELRNLYTTGAVPESIKKQQAAKRTGESDILKQMDQFQLMLDRGSLDLVPPSLTDQIVSVEGTGKNPTSSAEGPGQFTHGTFRDVMSRIHPEVKLPSDNAELAPLKAKYGREATRAYAQENQTALNSAGLPVTAETTYLAHFLGANDAIKVLRADPDTPIQNVINSRSYNANAHLHGKTVAETIQWAARFIKGNKG